MREAVIVTAVRTPLGSFNGSLSSVGSTLAVLKELQLDPARVNVNGGSVALGHPSGASGCSLLVTLLYEMFRQDRKTGLTPLCLGGGAAVAMVVRR